MKNKEQIEELKKALERAIDETPEKSYFESSNAADIRELRSMLREVENLLSGKLPNKNSEVALWYNCSKSETLTNDFDLKTPFITPQIENLLLESFDVVEFHKNGSFTVKNSYRSRAEIQKPKTLLCYTFKNVRIIDSGDHFSAFSSKSKSLGDENDSYFWAVAEFV